jgi:hypothetical protein
MNDPDFVCSDSDGQFVFRDDDGRVLLSGAYAAEDLRLIADKMESGKTA